MATKACSPYATPRAVGRAKEEDELFGSLFDIQILYEIKYIQIILTQFPQHTLKLLQFYLELLVA